MAANDGPQLFSFSKLAYTKHPLKLLLELLLFLEHHLTVIYWRATAMSWAKLWQACKVTSVGQPMNGLNFSHYWKFMFLNTSSTTSFFFLRNQILICQRYFKAFTFKSSFQYCLFWCITYTSFKYLHPCQRNPTERKLGDHLPLW